MDEAFTLAAVLDEILDGAHFEAVLTSEVLELRHAGHAAVGLQDLADDRRLLTPREPGQVGAAFRVSGAHEHPSILSTQTVDVPRTRQIACLGTRIDRHLDRSCPIECRRTRLDAGARVELDGESRAHATGVD